MMDHLRHLPDGSLVADVGCGNGKYMDANPKVAMIPMDFSMELVKICVSRGYPAMAADIMNIPLRSHSVDAVVCIAVLHHLSTHARRLQALRELLRVTIHGGTIFVQAWAFEQDEKSRRKFAAQDVMVPWCLARRFVPDDPDVLAAAHGVVDEARNVVVFNRYCYVYKEGELLALLQEAAQHRATFEVLHQAYDRSNWCLCVRVSKSVP